MDSYSIDLRKRVLEDCDAGGSTRQVALKYRVSESWVRRLKQRRRESGEIAARSSRNKCQPRWLPYAERLQELVRQQPDATLRQLRDRLGVSLSVMTLCRALRSLQLTFKKKSSMRPNKTGPMWRRDGKRGKPR
jgi:transposase